MNELAFGSNKQHFATILAVRKAGRLNIKTKMSEFEACVLIGWLVQSVR